MSKRFYVLYTLKEFYLPRIYKTKATVNKYIEENNKLEFKLFAKEEEAQLFSKSIEVKLEKKFKIKMVEYLQKSHREIEEINEKSAASGNGQEGEGKMEREMKEEGKVVEDGKKEQISEKPYQQQQQKIQVAEAKTLKVKVEKNNETKQEITKKTEQTIENSPPQQQETKSPVQVEKKQQEKQQIFVEQKQQVIEQIKEETKEQIAVVQETAREKVKQQTTANEQQEKEKVKQETPEHIINQPQVNELAKQEDKVQAKQQAKQLAKQEVIEQLKEQVKEQARGQVKEQPKEQVILQVKEQAKEQTEQMARQEVKEQAREQAKEQVKESAKKQVKEQVKEQLVIITKEQQTIAQTIVPTLPKQETPSISLAIPPSQHIPNLHLHHLFYPLSPKYLSFLYPKVIKYYNFPSICNLLRFHHLQANNVPILQPNPTLTLNISLIFKQNPGLSLVVLDIQSPSLPKEVNYLKTVVLGVKSKQEAKVLALIQGLKYASTFAKSSSLTINSNFPPLKNQQKSLDARVRHLFSQYLTQQQSFSRVSFV